MNGPDGRGPRPRLPVLLHGRVHGKDVTESPGCVAVAEVVTEGDAGVGVGWEVQGGPVSHGRVPWVGGTGGVVPEKTEDLPARPSIRPGSGPRSPDCRFPPHP